MFTFFVYCLSLSSATTKQRSVFYRQLQLHQYLSATVYLPTRNQSERAYVHQEAYLWTLQYGNYFSLEGGE
jgi:hypothetical protein